MVSELLYAADALRRGQGEVLQALGFGPCTTPSRTVQRLRAAWLLAYQKPNAQRPAILMTPAPIKSAYIWDLAPASSVVARCLKAALQVYLISWTPPKSGDESLGLDDYCHAISSCVEALSAETGQPSAFVAGHSLGGTLAAIFSSLHGKRVRGLIALEAPIAFGGGNLERFAAHGPSAMSAMGISGNVPGTMLDVASVSADAASFSVEPLIDWLESSRYADARKLHLQVRRWTLDERPMARRLFDEVLMNLYCENRFAEGRLRVGQRIADPAAIDAPILAVLDPRSRVVPAESIEAFRRLTSSPDVQILRYSGDTGVVMQHVGVLVGRNAHDSLWPQVVDWIHTRT